MYAGTVTVIVQRITMPPWSLRDWRCRLGFHHHEPISDDDIASASQFCTRCGKVERFMGVALVECIMTRKYMLIRENGPHHPATPDPGVRAIREQDPQAPDEPNPSDKS